MKNIIIPGLKQLFHIKKLGWMFIIIHLFIGPIQGQETSLEPLGNGLRLSTFDVDASPPIGSPLAYDSTANAWDLGLRAKGIIIMGAGQPIVLCAVDWIGIANESQDAFKSALAEAAGTVPERVAVHTLHQHDAPISDFGAEKILLDAGLDPAGFEGSFDRVVIRRLQEAIKVAITHTEPVTHIGLGEAEVHEVASNRRILDHDGKAIFSRTSSTKDSAMRAEPEGLIDPMVQLVSFWNKDKPLSVLSYYAVHPQSYYLTKVANPDFPGVARFFRQLAVPDALHVHFNGAGANVTAGKYNDGSHENRLFLAERLADGMKRAWESTQKQPINSQDVSWDIEEVALQPRENLSEIQEQMKTEGYRFLTNNMIKLAWMKRAKEGKRIGISSLSLGKARILHLPGELFVEYQLAAKAERPDLFVTMAAYGDYGPFYIGTAAAYQEGGYEITVSPVTPQAEPVLMEAIRNLLNKDNVAAVSKGNEENNKKSNSHNLKNKSKEVLENMEKAMGELPEMSKLPSFNLQIVDTHEEENYTRQNIIFTVAENEDLPAYLYLPKQMGTSKKLPAMLVLHGTGELGKQLVDGKSPLSNRALAKELANRGYVVIAPDYPSMGDMKDYNFASDRYESGTMKAIFNHMRSIDLLQVMPEVDPERIGVIGHSLGGHNAIFVGAFDPRLKVVVSSCGWTPFGYYNIGEEGSKKYGGKLGPWAQDRYMPLIKDKYKLEAEEIPFDFPEIIASLAPRAFFSNSPVNDSNFDFQGVKKGMQEAKSAFEEIGKENNIQVRYPLAGHDFPLEVRKEAYEFIDEILEHTPRNTEIR